MTDFHEIYDEALAKQVEAAEAEEAAEAAAEKTGKQTRADMEMQAYEAAMQQDDADAGTLVGARIANLTVLRREKPGKRALYVCREQRSGQEVRLRGFQLVRVARESVRNGLPVEMPGEPWRDEDDVTVSA